MKKSRVFLDEIKRLASFDPAGSLYARFAAAPPVFVKAFCISFGVAVAVFLYLIIHFPPCEHDWVNYLWGDPLLHLRVGRWFDPVVGLLFGFMRIPVIIHTTAIAAQVLAGLVAFSFLSNERRLSPILFFTLFVSIIPYVCTYLHFSIQSALFTFANLFAALSIFHAAKADRSLKAFMLSALFACLTPATYQPQINALATLFVLYVLCDWSNALQREDYSVWRFWKAVVYKALPIIAGMIAYAISIHVLKSFGLLYETMYQLALVQPHLLVEYGVKVIGAAFAALVSSQEFMPGYLRMLLLALLLLALANMLGRVWRSNLNGVSKCFHSCAVLLLALLAVVATKIIFLVSANNGYYNFRMQSGLIFLYASAAAILPLSRPGLYRNIIMAMLLVSLVAFSHNDFLYQALQVEQQKFAEKVTFDVINRIKANPLYNKHVTYRYVQLGNFINVKRELYARGSSNNNPDCPAGDQLFGEIELPLKGAMIKHAVMFDGSLITTRWPNGVAALPPKNLQEIAAYIQTHRPWPAEGSVAFLGDNIILVYADDGVNPLVRAMAGG